MPRLPVVFALALAACSTADAPADPLRDSGDASTRDAARDAAPEPLDPLAECARLDMPEPRTIADVVARIDALPQPTIYCLMASLPRPLSLVASLSATSLQPAVNSNTPRIFVMYEGVSLSVVGGGEGENAVEFGQWITPLRTLKAEIRWPITRPLASGVPYQGLVDPGQTISSCGFCHNGEEEHPTIPGAFVSDALAPGGLNELAVADLREVRAACTDESHCAILRALFDYGEVRQGAFDEQVRRGF
ncbi:MAG: hypothetical protein ABW352_25740 [Polyangiales bacterium]